MNSLDQIVVPLGWTLVHFLWQAAVIAGLFAVTQFVQRKASANARYISGCTTLLLITVFPIVTFCLKADFSKSQPNAAIDSSAIANPQNNFLPATAPTAGDFVPSVAMPQPSRPLDLIQKYLPWMVVCWLGGVVVLSLRFAGGLMLLQRIRSRGVTELTNDWQVKLADLKKRLRITRPVLILQSALVEVPTVIGWLKPVILLPASSFTGLTPLQLEAVLLHELAHVRRHDFIVNLLQSVLEILFFYHPAVWWISKKVREEREHCCDDIAIEYCGDRLTYARALTALEELRGSPVGLAMAADGGSLLGRIQRMLHRPAESRTGGWFAGALIIGIVVIMGVAGTLRAQIEKVAQEKRATDAPTNTVGKVVLQAVDISPESFRLVWKVTRNQPFLQRANIFLWKNGEPNGWYGGGDTEFNEGQDFSSAYEVGLDVQRKGSELIVKHSHNGSISTKSHEIPESAAIRVHYRNAEDPLEKGGYLSVCELHWQDAGVEYLLSFVVAGFSRGDATALMHEHVRPLGDGGKAFRLGGQSLIEFRMVEGDGALFNSTTNNLPLPKLRVRPTAVMMKDSSGRELQVSKDVLLNETAILRASAIEQPSGGRWSVSMQFTPEAAVTFAAITKQNLGRQLAIVIDGKLHSAPTIQSEISGGSIEISGNFTRADAEALAQKLNVTAPKRGPTVARNISELSDDEIRREILMHSNAAAKGDEKALVSIRDIAQQFPRPRSGKIKDSFFEIIQPSVTFLAQEVHRGNAKALEFLTIAAGTRHLQGFAAHSFSAAALLGNDRAFERMTTLRGDVFEMAVIMAMDGLLEKEDPRALKFLDETARDPKNGQLLHIVADELIVAAKKANEQSVGTLIFIAESKEANTRKVALKALEHAAKAGSANAKNFLGKVQRTSVQTELNHRHEEASKISSVLFVNSRSFGLDDAAKLHLLKPSLALLQSGSVNATDGMDVEKEWREAMKNDYLLFKLPEPFKQIITTEDNKSQRIAGLTELLIPMPRDAWPAYIFAKEGARTLAFSKYNPMELRPLVSDPKIGLQNIEPYKSLFLSQEALKEREVQTGGKVLPEQAVGRSDSEPLYWQIDVPYAPPSFEAFFPDDPAGGEKLDALWLATDKDQRGDEEILSTVRNGLRTTKQHRTVILRWIGNKYIWGKSPQNPQAIEIMYQAADFSGPNHDPYGTRHYAVYFGLSVVNKKTPAILRTLADLAVSVDDPNDLERIIWGCASQRAELLAFLQPHLDSSNGTTRAKAEVVEKIFKQELKAFAWAKEQARQKAEKEFAGELPQLREILISGGSTKRAEVLKKIANNRIALIMDDSFIEAFAKCADDNAWNVREMVAVIAGDRWVWSAQEQHPDAIAIMLKLSHDSDYEVRYDAVYYGLSTVRNKSDAVIERLLELLQKEKDPNMRQRIEWGLRDDKKRVAELQARR